MIAEGAEGAGRGYERAPGVVIWETTQGCELVCRPCRAGAVRTRHPGELTTAEGVRLLNDIRRFGYPLVILTGGDPLMRPDLVSLVKHGARLGLPIAVTPSGTPLVTAEVLRELRDAGLARLIVSLDGSSEGVHDSRRGVQGSFDWTLRMLRAAREVGIPVQVDTVAARRNLEDLRGVHALLAELGVALWSVRLEEPLARIPVAHLPLALARSEPIPLERAAEPQYLRQLLGGRADAGARALFIGHTGEIYHSESLPAAAGHLRRDYIVDLYRAQNGAVGEH